MRKHFLVSLVLLLACALQWPGLARAAQVSGVQIISFGIYQAERVGVSGQTKEGRPIGSSKNYSLIEQTNRIPLRLGLRFGINYTVNGTPQGAEVPIIIKRSGPPLSPPNGGVVSSGTYQTTRILGGNEFSCYLFEQPWEMVPGQWTFQVIHEGRVLAEKTFTVYKP